jgi:prepilin-type N-terminal cleavage/methylation domain-containing protein/prepilin-type processing-associated H-X9-DG protein
MVMKLTPRRTAFTLVELLVVISIIGALTAILLPAVNQAREAARQATCTNHLAQLGKAVLSYATTKQKMPSYLSAIKSWEAAAPGTYAAGWIYPILPYVEQQSSRDAIDGVSAPPPPNDVSALQSFSPEIAFLICPSDTPSGTAAGSLGYMCNAGFPDAGPPPPGSPSPPPPDWRENGVFSRSKVSPGFSELTISIDSIASNDGTSTTIMASENARANTPYEVSPGFSVVSVWGPTSSYLSQDTGNTEFYGYRAHQNIVWFAPDNGGPPTLFLFNNSNTRESNPASDAALQAPSSRHPGGFVLLFCDGHTTFVSDQIGYEVYARLMSSNGRRVRPPLSSAAPSNWFNPSDGWLLNKPVSEADYQF